MLHAYVFKCFRLFQTFVSSVSSGCCKSRSGCCICCNNKIRMLQAYVSCVPMHVANVSSACFKSRSWCCTCCKWLYTHVLSHVLSVSYDFIHMLQIFRVDVSKVDLVLHMLQWRRWLTDGGLPQGFTSYLVPSAHDAPRPLLSSPSPPFPSLHHRSQFELGP